MITKGRTNSGGVLSEADLRPGAERRAEPRVPCDRPIAIIPCHPRHRGGFIDVTMFDCSRNGIGIRADAPMRPPEQFVAKLMLDRMMMIVYTVRHCRQLPTGQYQIGAELTRLTGMELVHSDDFLDALLTHDHTGRAA